MRSFLLECLALSATSAFAQDQCDVADVDKIDCGFVGITKDDCQVADCCWKAGAANSVAPWCFAKRIKKKLPAGWHPVVVSGPLLGQSLEARNSDEGSWCNTRGKWSWGWGNIKMDNPLCMIQDLKLQGWDSKQNLAIHKPKVQVRPRGGFENTMSGLSAIGRFFDVEIVDGHSHLTGRLEELGYVQGDTFIGHAYDWRLGVHDWQVSSFPALRKLIQNVTQATGQPAVLTGVSMAGPYHHAFLSWAKSQDPGWAARHIHALVPVAAPWNGAVMALSAVIASAIQTWSTDGHCPQCDPPKNATGPSLDNNFVDEMGAWFGGKIKGVADEVLKKLIWNWPSMYFMSTGIDYSTHPPTDPEVVTMLNGATPPQCRVDTSTSTKCGGIQTREGWAFDDPKYLNATQCAECYKQSTLSTCKDDYFEAFDGWVTSLCCKKHQCDAKTYKASELPELLRKIGREGSADMMKYAHSVGTTTDPGVPVHCIFGHNVQTFQKLAFHTSEDLEANEPAQVTLDDGDQTVDAASAEVCTRWPSTKKVYRIPGVSHASMLDVEQVLDVITAVATNNDQKWMSWKAPLYDEVKTFTKGTKVAPEVLLKVNKKHPLKKMMNLFI